MPNDNVLTDAAITACALMIKGICLTKPSDEWAAHIEKRIRFMLSTAGTPTLTQGQPEPRAEVTDDDKLDAERYRWMAERFLGADFEWGRGEDGYGGIPALIIKIPENAKVWGCLDLTVDYQLGRATAS